MPVFDVEPALFSREVSYVTQNPEDQLVSFDVFDELCFGPENLCLGRDAIIERVNDISRALGLAPFLGMELVNLSGGKKQLVSIASQLIMGSSTLILDEPLAFLDQECKAQLLRSLVRMKQKGGESGKPVTLIIIDHDVDAFIPLVDRVMHISPIGKIDFDAPVHAMFQFPLKDVPETLSCSWIVGALTRHLKGDVQDTSTIEDVLDFLRQAYTGSTTGAMNRHVQDFLAANAQTTRTTLGMPRGGSTTRETAGPVIRLAGVRFSYDHDKPLFSSLNVTINRGEMVGIFGKNGSGKTTLLQLMAKILTPDAGTIYFGDTNINELPDNLFYSKIGFIFQNPECQIFCDTVKDELGYTVKNFFGRTLEDVELDGLQAMIGLDGDGGQVNPYQLSWGQKRRLTVACAMAHHPEVIMLDEPFIGHDAPFKERMMQVLRDVNDAGTTVIIVTHDIELLVANCDRILVIDHGTAMDIRGTDELPHWGTSLRHRCMKSTRTGAASGPGVAP